MNTFRKVKKIKKKKASDVLEGIKIFMLRHSLNTIIQFTTCLLEHFHFHLNNRNLKFYP